MYKISLCSREFTQNEVNWLVSRNRFIEIVESNKKKNLEIAMELPEIDIDVEKLVYRTAEIHVPANAAGRMIGKKGIHINMLKNMSNIRSVYMKTISPHGLFLVVTGSEEAVHQVEIIAQIIIAEVEGKDDLSPKYKKGESGNLANNSRKVHSWLPTASGAILTPREVHKTGTTEPKKGTIKYDKEQRRIRIIREVHERNPQILIPKNKKVSSKEIKERNAEFELAKAQFETVKAARVAAEKNLV